jgi:hypothetical protein
MKEVIEINKLPEKYENVILPMMFTNPKFTLGGSLALYILGLMKCDFSSRVPDIDFSLTEALDEEELNWMMSFFELKPATKPAYDATEFNTKDLLKNELILLEKDIVLDFTNPDKTWKKYYKVDIFNKDYLPKKDWFELDYFGTKIKVTHPSIIFAAKMKYATDLKVGKQRKHFNDIQSTDWDNYFKTLKHIQVEMEQYKEINDDVSYQDVVSFRIKKYYFTPEMEIYVPTSQSVDLPF